MSSQDEHWMLQALDLALRGQGFVEPNPLVGAIVVNNGQIVGQGWHERFGGDHAEVNALRAAGDRTSGATLYVTLEPCCHHGKTPPCTAAVIKSGIQRVVAAMADPFPQVSGHGFAALKRAGIGVTIGVCEPEARRLNAPYLTLIEKGRPWVHAKWAMTLDGFIADRNGNSKWISGEQSRAVVHQLRGRMDAIIVGAGTVRKDDPLLTARPAGPRTPARIIVSSTGRLPDACQLLRTSAEAPVIVATSSQEMASSGVEIVTLPSANGQVSLVELMQELGRRRMTNVLVEGGSHVLGSFIDADLIDEFHVFIAPKLLGDGLAPIHGLGVGTISDAVSLADASADSIGRDTYIHARR